MMKSILKKAMPILMSAMLLFVSIGILPAEDVHASPITNLQIKKELTMAYSGVKVPDIVFTFTATRARV